MGTPINTPLTSEIWHLTIDDLLEPLPASPRLGGPGPFVINLSASTAPISVPMKAVAEHPGTHVYQIQRTEDRRVRYRLRLGPFETEAEAEALLSTVREIYPSALTASAEAEDLRSIEAIKNKIEAQQLAAVKAAMSKAAAASLPNGRTGLARAAAPEAAERPPGAPTDGEVLPTSPPPAWLALRTPKSVPAEQAVDLDVPTPAAKPSPKPPPASVKTAAPAPAKSARGFAPARWSAAARAFVPSADFASAAASASTVDKAQAGAPAAGVSAGDRRNSAGVARDNRGARASRGAYSIRRPRVIDSRAVGQRGGAALHAGFASGCFAHAGAQSLRSCARKFADPRRRDFLGLDCTAGRSCAAGRDNTAAGAGTGGGDCTCGHGSAPGRDCTAGRDCNAGHSTTRVRDRTPRHLGAGGGVGICGPVRGNTGATGTRSRAVISRARPADDAWAAHRKAAPRTEAKDARVASFDTTQTLRPLTPTELQDAASLRWFVIQLSCSEEAFDPDALPNLDIFSEYRLYSVASLEQGKTLHSLRVGFFSEESHAKAVAGYLGTFYNEPTVKRISAAERTRFAQHRVEARKDIGATGKHTVIEITDERVIRPKRSGNTSVSPMCPPLPTPPSVRGR